MHAVRRALQAQRSKAAETLHGSIHGPHDGPSGLRAGTVPANEDNKIMTQPSLNFIRFDEALAIARSSPGVELIGLSFTAPFDYLGVYTIRLVDDDEPQYVSIIFDGGTLFSSCGEEGFFDVNDVPDEAKKLFYVDVAQFESAPDIGGVMGEYVLQDLLPGLGGEDAYSNRAEFKRAAAAAFSAYWRPA
jgi:hypothetical protein